MPAIAAFDALTRPMFASLAGVAAQTDADAARLRDAGARDVAVTGNLKFDVAVPPSARALGRALRERFGAARPVFVAASTREGEEALLLDALARRPLPAGTLTVIVPRHPQRFAAVARRCWRRAACASSAAAATRRSRPTSASCSATRWASSWPTTPRPTSPSSAAACCRSAGRT